MSLDREAFRKHLTEAPFQLGIDKGRWEIADMDNFPAWPYVIIRIYARPKESGPSYYSFRFDLTGYPSSAPNACVWDEDKSEILENSRWPKGSMYVSKVFNPAWRRDALYSPCDRHAIPGHDGWRVDFPEYYWRPEFTIVKYLQFIYGLLNSDDYEGG